MVEGKSHAQETKFLANVFKACACLKTLQFPQGNPVPNSGVPEKFNASERWYQPVANG